MSVRIKLFVDPTYLFYLIPPLFMLFVIHFRHISKFTKVRSFHIQSPCCRYVATSVLKGQCVCRTFHRNGLLCIYETLK